MARPCSRGKTALIATALVAGVMTSVTPAAAADKSAPQSPAAYLTWLAAQNDAESKEVASQFKALSAADKQKFLDYLNNAAVLKAAQDVQADPDLEPDPESKALTDGRLLTNGDVTIEVESGAAPVDSGATPSAARAAGKAGDWQCWYTFKQKIFGITITKLKLEQWYRSSTKKVTKIYNVAASKKNLNPGVNISNEPEEQWISRAGNALAYVTWHGDITVSGHTVQVDKRQHIRCDETGGRYQYMKNI